MSGSDIFLQIREVTNGAPIVATNIPARLDALLWSSYHTRVIAALGITWILDGLEVPLAGSLAGALTQSQTLQFSNLDIGFAASAYLVGAVLGALGFGWLTDRIGRRKLFFITLAVYLFATAGKAPTSSTNQQKTNQTTTSEKRTRTARSSASSCS